MLSNLQTPEAHSQQVSVDNSPMTKPEAILTPAHSSLQSIPSSDTNSSTGSVPDTVLMSPDFPAATRDSAPTQAVVEPSSKRASLVLDDAASEKSVYYTPRNSFYLNRNGSASISTLVLDKIGEGQRTTDDEEPFEMPGAWTWGAIETPSKSMSEHIPNVFSEDHGEIPVEQALDQNKPAEPPASAAPVIVESFACVQPIDTPALPAAQEAPASSTLPTLPTSHGASDEGLVMDHESDSGSFEITERSGVEPPAEAICTSAQAGTMSDEPSEKTGTPHVHFSELPTFHLQPPTPATLTDVRVGCLPDLDSRPLHGEPGLPEGTQVSVVRALSSTAPLSPAMSASNVYLDDEIDLDSFAPEEIAYYNPYDPSPYEAAARAHAARLGLASGLNPNVLTVLPEMSVQDSNQLYLPQRRNSRKLGSSSSDLGARGNMAPKQSASLLYARRYSCAASDMGQTAQMYASSELAPPLDTGDLNRRHSFNPRPSSLGSRNEVPRARSRTQSVRVPSRIGDSTHDDLVAPSNGTGVISLDTPSGRPLNNFPLMESNAYDQTQQSGYTNMVLPKGGNFKPGDPAKANRLDLQLLGVPPTSMGAVTLSSALHSYHLKHQSPTPEHLRWTLPPPVDFSTITPPHQVSRAQILIQVYAVAVDWLDIAALDEKSKHDVGRWVPGRSFVGRCITTGADEKEIGRGDMVIGLVDIRHSGALAEYIVTDRRRVARVNRDTRLELEELAALPAQGIAVHRAIRDVGVIRGQQALVMDAHEGLPALFCQELTRMGLVVTAIVPGGVEKAQGDALACGARGVLVGSPSTVMHGLPENLFALVVDTAGAADAARRILIDGGHVLSLKSGVGPAQRRTLKTKLGLGKRKNVSVSYIQPAGAGEPAVDASGLDYRDVLEEPVLGVLRPSVEEVVPFELGASVFTSRRNMDRLRVAVVQIVN
ncbi:hypothetical protein CspeluHIS016_0503520 [Cutaneotrichosporon spelunceum]|uniref:Enoyl reductase (ER) domain-containing protein n=1 Tax=Cutaneotrichosporon spelunceum TaxID=1672016 RepID=A0AAD3TWQ7_9TREE|nr:hypothetical protein CspeluHIS016_0503520 [Cutaneotrichosporon spelunceum]